MVRRCCWPSADLPRCVCRLGHARRLTVYSGVAYWGWVRNVTGISAVVALAADVGILGVGLKTEQQSSVRTDIVQTAFASVFKIQHCATRFLQRSQARYYKCYWMHVCGQCVLQYECVEALAVQGCQWTSSSPYLEFVW